MNRPIEREASEINRRTARKKVPPVAVLFVIPALSGIALIVAMLIPLLSRPGYEQNVPGPLETGEVLLSNAARLVADTEIPSTGMSMVAILEAATRLGPESPRIRDTPSQGLFWIDAPHAVIAEYLLDKMTDEEILGQLFMVGWPDENATGPVMDWIRQRNIGGVKVFGWNGNKVYTLTEAMSAMQKEALESKNGIPLLTATDQEGGWVRHVKDTTSLTPGNMAIGASGIVWDAYESSYLIALELRAMGINMNFAPTVDVYINPEAHVIGPRAYGSDPVKVGILSVAALRGMADAGVIATAKHFPGHGNATGDSHGMMPILPDNLDTLWNRDLVPYRMLISEGIPAVLVGHLAFPSISKNGRPATLSSELNRELLRESLGFQGLVITDDLYMGGAWEYGASHGWGLPDIVVESIRAGNDMVMLSRTPEINDRVWTALLQEYGENETFRSRVRDSVRRILLVKLTYLKPGNRVPLRPDPATADREVPATGSRDYFREQAARAVTIVKSDNLPLVAGAGRRVLLVGQDRDFLRMGQRYFPSAQTYFFPYEPFYQTDRTALAELRVLAADMDLIVFSMANPNGMGVLRGLEAFADKIGVLSTLTPIYFRSLPWIKAGVAVYGWGTDSFAYGFEALLGRYEAPGSLPISMED